MRKEFEIDECSSIEEQIDYYRKCLSVQNPEQVVKYLEKRLEKYIDTLKNADLYPEKIILSIKHLILEYSLDIAIIKNYLDIKN
ncbi:hypothetical protein QUF88_14455 [Bacillus sp. DX1.1]|uniref:hypothetical protein n=1 Tax=unclassified Bacillus (in: firmicutes) TaxID=185979 RepID=UPI00256FEC85|nr:MULTISPECIES: hypothetical protein [unclassified Bacillus (in: firmicutes)]MDM5154977.1 hypothetical protein [Bacillus sp. DX1.1]WJE83840.1 hypothetical protein QRE67_11950 [Bacillus sp. DX3.1]